MDDTQNTTQASENVEVENAPQTDDQPVSDGFGQDEPQDPIAPGSSFSEALEALKKGFKVTRQGWNGKGMYLKAQFPDENSKMEKPYIYIFPGEGFTVPWVASQADLFGEDWIIL